MDVNQFLNRYYLPSYVTVVNHNHDGRNSFFEFRPVEPPVTIFSDAYVTPRGTHIMVSQASFCVVDNLVRSGELPMSPEEYYELGLKGRFKLVEFNQRFRREIGLDDVLQGKLTVTGLRLGRLPFLKIDFDLGSKAISGSLTAMIAPHPVHQTNADIMRH